MQKQNPIFPSPPPLFSFSSSLFSTNRPFPKRPSRMSGPTHANSTQTLSFQFLLTRFLTRFWTSCSTPTCRSSIQSSSVSSSRVSTCKPKLTKGLKLLLPIKQYQEKVEEKTDSVKARIDSSILGLALKVDYNVYYQSSQRPDPKKVVIKKLPSDFYSFPVKQK